MNVSNIIIKNEQKTINLFNNKNFIRYFLDLKGNKSKYTSKSYERDIKDFFKVEYVEDITIDHIRSVSIFDAQNYILELTSKNLSSATINRKISSLSALYKWLLKYQDNSTGKVLIKYNPFGNLKEEKPVINNKDTEFLTKEECKILLQSIDTTSLIGIRNKAIMSLALTTALRKSEIINIKLKDVTTYGNYNVINITRKGNVKDMVKIQDGVLQLINQYVEKSNRDFKKNCDEYLFLGHSKNSIKKEKLNPSSLNYIIKEICKKANINKNLKVHSTRHTAITIAITEGATIEKVREFAGHKNLATTNRYVHSIDKLKNNAGDIIDIL
ncbi:MAG: tyrosine-type recombinase/integrase [Clostridium argentinense]|uniref:Tyrosine-type recombinase/integrase n=1 Tax=Clostridium faecium TaxID=2762223 RepID=A0ABR8YW72_9CLOT|nr:MULTISPECIES: tyrosine-type recombinase/integrase [Clostridium]MBD8048084.1 tyrosine-type recombinase/integrase [Clostridium faecium]MBS5825264.1 tyrosine-type recombinase/integrase [Clostridium argentinense]